MKMLPVLFEWDKGQIEEAIEFGNQTRIDRGHCRGAIEKLGEARKRRFSLSLFR